MNREKTSWGINIYMWKQTAMVYCYLLLNEKPAWNLLVQTRMSFLLALLGSLTGLCQLVAQLWLRFYDSLTGLLLELAVAWISLSLLLLFSSKARASPRGSRSILRDWRQKLRGLLSPRLWSFQLNFCHILFIRVNHKARPDLMDSDGPYFLKGVVQNTVALLIYSIN